MHRPREPHTEFRGIYETDRKKVDLYFPESISFYYEYGVGVGWGGDTDIQSVTITKFCSLLSDGEQELMDENNPLE